MSLIERFNLEETLSMEKLEEKLEVFRQHQSYFFMGVIVVTGLQLFFGLTLPSMQKYAKESEVLKQYTALLDMRTKQSLNKEAIQKELKRLNTLLAENKSVLFTPKEVEKFSISQLPKMAEQSGIKVTSVKFKEPQTSGNGVKQHALTLVCSTTFKELMAFVYALEQYNRTMYITDFSIQRTTIDPVIIKVTMRVNLVSLKET